MSMADETPSGAKVPVTVPKGPGLDHAGIVRTQERFMPVTHLRLRTLPSASILLALSLAACSGGGSTSTPTAAVVTPTATAEASSGAAAAASAAASAASTDRVSANTSSEAEIAAALAAAGVPNATRWAREVTEYRPYPTDDPTLQRLQDNLAKYNPDPATLAAILSALVP